MSSDFTPIKMRPIIAEDSLYSRQNQYGTKQSAKADAEKLLLPSNDDINAKVATALEMMKKSVFPDRGSILNIVV